MPIISVVSPVYLAAGNVSELCRRLELALNQVSVDYEIVLVEDGSPDSSWDEIVQEASRNSKVRGLKLSRNFGQHHAITAGVDFATGDWVVVMDCDLQDPPESIPQLYKKAKEGNDLVVALFEERQGKKTQQLFSRVFWRLLTWLTDLPFDHRVGNFRIFSRKVADSFKLYREQARLLGGINSLAGFRTSNVLVKRAERFSGRSAYTFRKLVSTALNLALAYSDKPLRIMVALGFTISGMSFIAGLVIFGMGLSGIISVPGWVSVMVSLYLLSGLILANLGIVGFYVGKTFEESKKRPLYIVETAI
jgi:glycosyltransferase involved in cell wall biosynthesis